MHSTCSATSISCSTMSTTMASTMAINNIMLMNNMILLSTISSRNSFYNNRDEDDIYAILQVRFKNPVVNESDCKGFFQKVFGSPDKWETETLKQTAFLKNIATVLKLSGFTNIVFIEINRKKVYQDKSQKENDIDKAMSKAFRVAEKPRGGYNVCIGIDSDNNGAPDAIITMKRKHDADEYPLTIEIISDKHPRKTLLALRRNIKRVFDVKKIIEEKH